MNMDVHPLTVEDHVIIQPRTRADMVVQFEYAPTSHAQPHDGQHQRSLSFWAYRVVATSAGARP